MMVLSNEAYRISVAVPEVAPKSESSVSGNWRLISVADESSK